MLFFMILATTLLSLLLLLFFLLLFLAFRARFVVHTCPSAVQRKKLAIENANKRSKSHGQPEDHKQYRQDRGPDPEGSRVENHVAELDSCVREDTL